MSSALSRSATRRVMKPSSGPRRSRQTDFRVRMVALAAVVHRQPHPGSEAFAQQSAFVEASQQVSCSAGGQHPAATASVGWLSGRDCSGGADVTFAAKKRRRFAGNS